MVNYCFNYVNYHLKVYYSSSLYLFINILAIYLFSISPNLLLLSKMSTDRIKTEIKAQYCIESIIVVIETSEFTFMTNSLVY